MLIGHKMRQSNGVLARWAMDGPQGCASNALLPSAQCSEGPVQTIQQMTQSLRTGLDKLGALGPHLVALKRTIGGFMAMTSLGCP